jgi:hypothetical protein
MSWCTIQKQQILSHHKFADLRKGFCEIAADPVDLQCIQAMDSEGEFQTIDLKINEFNEIVGDCQCDGFNGPVSTCTSIYLSNLPLYTCLSENIQ